MLDVIVCQQPRLQASVAAMDVSVVNGSTTKDHSKFYDGQPRNINVQDNFEWQCGQFVKMILHVTQSSAYRIPCLGWLNDSKNKSSSLDGL